MAKSSYQKLKQKLKELETEKLILLEEIYTILFADDENPANKIQKMIINEKYRIQKQTEELFWMGEPIRLDVDLNGFDSNIRNGNFIEIH